MKPNNMQRYLFNILDTILDLMIPIDRPDDPLQSPEIRETHPQILTFGIK
jgi:hypothetical protein